MCIDKFRCIVHYRFMTRLEKIRLQLGLAQHEKAQRLRVSQSAVCRIENGQPETGPMSLLLDQLETQLIAEGLLPSQDPHYPDAPRVADDTPERAQHSGTLAAERERTSPVVVPSSSAAFCDADAAVAYAGGCDGGSC